MVKQENEVDNYITSEPNLSLESTTEHDPHVPSTSNTVLGMLGLSWQSEAGMVVVGADYADWSAVSGAQISVSDSDAQAFVLGAGGMPALGDTIPAGGMGMVSFANVRVGEVSVELTPPDGVSCAPHPGGGGYMTVPVEADTVTVISYRCEGGDR